LFGVISFRTLVAAAAFFGVAGKAALSAGYAQSTSLILAGLVGLAAMYGMYWLMRSIANLSSSGNERIGNAVGLQATVYIPIPAARTGAGKVQLSMQNRIVEYQAVTDDAEPLKTGDNVEVVGVAGSDIVSVRRIPAAVQA
jgi:membrane protein implicated in regulation of membrane protease activity